MVIRVRSSQRYHNSFFNALKSNIEAFSNNWNPKIEDLPGFYFNRMRNNDISGRPIHPILRWFARCHRLRSGRVNPRVDRREADVRHDYYRGYLLHRLSTGKISVSNISTVIKSDISMTVSSQYDF